MSVAKLQHFRIPAYGRRRERTIIFSRGVECVINLRPRYSAECNAHPSNEYRPARILRIVMEINIAVVLAAHREVVFLIFISNVDVVAQ